MSVLASSKEDIFRQIQAHQQTLEGYGVKRLELFGSFVRGNVQEESDVGVLVVFDPERKTFRNFMDLSFFLEDLFERRVDVVTPESLSPYLDEKILSEVEYVSSS